jgi:NAD(P)-dependent dehydrogenase (short-subunit alcohol dehydrogenase family)
MTLNKKRVFISGAGRGLGRATARAFLEAGYFVIATDIDTALLSDLSSVNNVLTFHLDVSSEEETEACAKTIEERFGGIDVLVSNAGIFDFYPVAEAGIKKLSKLFDVNVFGLANLSKYFLPLLIKSAGRLIVISSESHKVPAPFQPYTVSKQALEAVYKAIKMELSVKNIKCVLIRPGQAPSKPIF